MSANAGQKFIYGHDAQGVIATGHVQHFETDSNGYGWHYNYLIHHHKQVCRCKWNWLVATDDKPQTVETWCVTYADD